MIDVEEVIEFHNILLEEHGGGRGVRDDAGLQAAINRPFSTFDGVDLYPLIEEKAAAIFESLVINHPFIDGNKRIAYFMLELLLSEDCLGVNATQEEKYAFVISASMGELRYEGILAWLKNNVTPIK